MMKIILNLEFDTVGQMHKALREILAGSTAIPGMDNNKLTQLATDIVNEQIAEENKKIDEENTEIEEYNKKIDTSKVLPKTKRELTTLAGKAISSLGEPMKIFIEELAKSYNVKRISDIPEEQFGWVYCLIDTKKEELKNAK